MKHAAELAHFFVPCNDVEAMRSFYVDLLGMEEYQYAAGQYVNVKTAGLIVMFIKVDETVPAHADYAWQPGWEGGTGLRPSFSVKIAQEDFAALTERLRGTDIARFNERPEWRQDSYWGLTINDPTGMTLELWIVPDERPQSTEWPGG